jgi:GNAT superfamily N-acetyltransferase
MANNRMTNPYTDRNISGSKLNRKIELNVIRYTGNDMISRDISKFVDVIFDNFKDIENNKQLNHNTNEITRILISPKSITILCVYDKQIIGYLIGELTVVDDLKQLMHIMYIFTSPAHRSKGIATYLLNLIGKYARELNINTLSLTFDTYNKHLEKFYLNNNFIYDSNLRSYQRYDMLVKYI